MTISRRNFVQSAAAAVALLSIKNNAIAAAAERTGIKDFYKDDFRIGTILSNEALSTAFAGFIGVVLVAAAGMLLGRMLQAAPEASAA